MHIHFVCSGNTNRSRMAEAYLRAKNISGLRISSSGNTATPVSEGNGLSKYAERVLGDADLLGFASSNCVITNVKQLREADLVIFMAQKHFDHARDNLQCRPAHYEIWKIGDIPQDFWWWLIPVRKKKLADDRDIFEQIKEKVDDLVVRVIKTSGPLSAEEVGK